MARSVPPSGSPPQHYQLLRVFRQLKDQAFPHLSRELVEVCRTGVPAGALAEIDWIRSFLRPSVLALLAPRQRWMNLHEWQSLLFARFHELLSTCILEK